VNDAVTNAWYADANRYHDRFERAFAAHLGVRHAMALPSCTSGLRATVWISGTPEAPPWIVAMEWSFNATLHLAVIGALWMRTLLAERRVLTPQGQD